MKFKVGKCYMYNNHAYWYCMGRLSFLIKNRSGTLHHLQETRYFSFSDGGWKEIKFDITPYLKEIKKLKAKYL